VTVEPSNSASCGNIQGFTKLGEYNGHGYYLSNAGASWNDAKTLAENAGGYLVTINDQTENDFVKSNLINNLVFIGFNDATTEGTGQWANNEPVTLDLSYDNTDGSDYAVMNFWAGTWQMVNQSVIKPFIMEVNCGAGTNTLTLACPDNIVVQPATGGAIIPAWDEPVATSTCEGPVSIAQDGGPPPGTEVPYGVYDITYLAIDNCDDYANCSFTIDMVEPFITPICPDDITVTATSDEGATVEYAIPVFDTNLPDDANVVVGLVSGMTSGSLFPVGTTTITYEFINYA